MSNLITLDRVSLAYGLDALLDKIRLDIAAGERICLIGRNGAGKSSLLKIIEGTVLPDSGTVWRKPALRLAKLDQEVPKTNKTVFEFVAEGLASTGDLLIKYHALIHNFSEAHTQAELDELEKVQHQIEVIGGWQYEQEINTVLANLELNPDALVSTLSGGWQRRAALARALVVSPELLLLDEPTNHLDIEAIKWMENYLLNCKVALIFITHDRALLQRLATRIIELDRGQLTSWPGDYQNFLLRKAEMLHAEDRHNAEFDKKLAQEEKWIRQGIKARRTRNEGRVRALEALRRERKKRREVQGTVNMAVHAADMSGQLVVETHDISQEYNGQRVIDRFSLRIMRGDRIGLVGPNGVGKSTLLNLLLNKIEPQSGNITLGTKLEIAYFDQLRAALDENKTVAENVTLGSDTLEINGEPRHIISYLSDFLFTPQRARTPVKALSGGERNRLLLARLFSKPSNLLVMDEPTNDLDIETLELLEDLLVNYPGTILLVSHDRQFIDNVVTSLLIFEGKGKITEFAGGYQDWLQQQQKVIVSERPQKKIEIIKPESKNKSRLSFKEQQELKELPLRIEQLEAEQQTLQARTMEPDFYQQSPEKIQQGMDALTALTLKLEVAYARWTELDVKSIG